MLVPHSTLRQHRHCQMLQYFNGNNATCASETDNGRPITAVETGKSSKYGCLAKTPHHFSCCTHGLFKNEHCRSRIMAVDVKMASDFLIIFSTGLRTFTYQFNSYNTRFQVIMAGNIRGPVFWNAMQCIVVYSYQCCYKEHGISIFMEVIHQTTHHHMPEDIFLKKQKFYSAH